ncbi:hypothetical protein [Winogradskyella arenosi]|uniref:Uncharacterized protein n=1 Tax=Winogradskyella arenosi TaxID=533325 RepID=A0A368ZI34_9FLAO|nr:hypothetical protein [Winogradskyella arenosi]RCW93442.1 hypothetical protein DFQ08_101236 [Winogradskyella arenosi]
MKLRYILLFLSFIGLSSCNEDAKNETVVQEVAVETTSKKITAKMIESLEYRDFALSPEADRAIASWGEYHELGRQLDFLKRGDFSFFNGDKAVLKKFILEFKNKLPEAFETNPIESRIAVIETELLQLNENLTLDNIKNTTRLESIKGLFIAFSNLNDMMNKKLERETYNKILPE